MKLGVIGSGMIVKNFLPKLRALPGLELYALQSTPRSAAAAQALCAANGIPHAVQDFDALCATGIDTVYVATPNHLHYACCRQALERGLNVIVEKPIASNAREAQELWALAKKTGALLFEAITTLYLGNYAKIREWLPRIGAIKLVQSQYSQYSSRYDAFRRGEVLPAFDPARSGGALMDLGVYNLHYVMGLFGMPASSQYHANVERGIDTSGVLTLQYPGFQALCVAAKDCDGASNGGCIQGTEGSIKSSLPANLVGEVTLTLRDGTVERCDDGMGAERQAPEFSAFIRGINAHDEAFCRAMMEKSLSVSTVLTAARLQAGVRFPADETPPSYIRPDVGMTRAHLTALEQQEAMLRFPAFGSAEALRLGGILAALAPEYGSVAVQITRQEDALVLFQYMADDKAPRYFTYLAGKRNTVTATGHSSLWAYVKQQLDGSLQALYADASHNLLCAGGFPIRVGDTLVATLAVSGLHDGKDHELLIRALAQALNRRVPRYTGPCI